MALCLVLFSIFQASPFMTKRNAGSVGSAEAEQQIMMHGQVTVHFSNGTTITYGFEIPYYVVAVTTEGIVIAPSTTYSPVPIPSTTKSTPSADPTYTMLTSTFVSKQTSANTWYYVWVGFGTTFSTTVNVALTGLLNKGEQGHIEDPTSPYTASGIYLNGFYYRGYSNSQNYLGASWIAVGY